MIPNKQVRHDERTRHYVKKIQNSLHNRAMIHSRSLAGIEQPHTVLALAGLQRKASITKKASYAMSESATCTAAALRPAGCPGHLNPKEETQPRQRVYGPARLLRGCACFNLRSYLPAYTSKCICVCTLCATHRLGKITRFELPKSRQTTVCHHKFIMDPTKSRDNNSTTLAKHP